MQRSRSVERLTFDPDIERTLTKLIRAQKGNRERVVMATPDREVATRALREFALAQPTGMPAAIKRPAIAANNFEIKLALLQMIESSLSFHGLPSDDPHAHLANFLEICETFKYNGVTDDAVHLRLFPFSLKDKAKCWLMSQPIGSITN